MFSQLLKYIAFIFNSKSKYAIHSPFVYDFIEEILENNTRFYSFLAVEHIRNKLKNNHQKINVIDLGAGSKKKKQQYRKVSKIAKNSLQHKQMAQLLFRLINHYQLNPNVIELGTSLGVTTSYLSLANKKNKIISIEGSQEIARVASEVFKSLGLKNIELEVGNFDDVLPRLLANQKAGLIYIDGNHTKAATLNYFLWSLEKIDENSIIVFDDIYWSDQMEEAWKEIVNNKRVTLSIDLFKMGIVFFHPSIVKEHYKLRKAIF